MDHNTLITILSDMGVPGWLLKLVIAFLSERSMILRYKGACSSRMPLPGGGPQGTILGLFLFLILINYAGFKDLCPNVGQVITKVAGRRRPIMKAHMKFVDDITILEAVNIKEKVIKDPNPNPVQPTTYHARTGHFLPPAASHVHNELVKIQ